MKVLTAAALVIAVASAGGTAASEETATVGPTDAGADYGRALDEAVAAARGGDREAARGFFVKLAAEYPGKPEIYYNGALTWEFDDDGNRYRGKELNRAAAGYQKALEVDADFVPARFNLGVVWQKLGYLEEAARDYRLVAKSGGDLAAQAEYNLALVLKAQGRPAEAAAVLEKEKLAYDDAARVRLLALLAEATGDYGRAIALWKRTLVLDETPPWGALGRKHLRTLREY